MRLAELLAQLPELSLYDLEGIPLAEGPQLLAQAARSESELDHLLTVTSEAAARLALDSLWYRIRTDRLAPSAVLLEAVEPTELLGLLGSELQHCSVVFCDPAGRIAALNGAAEGLLRYVAAGPLLGRPFEPLLGLETPLSPNSASPLEILLPVDTNASLALDLTSEAYRGGRLVRMESKPYFSNSVTADWQSLVDHFPGVVVRLDRYGRVLFASRRVGGFTADEIRGQEVFDFVREDSRVTLDHFRNQIVRDRQTLSGELPILDRRDGGTIWYAFQAVPISVGSDVQVVVYAVDITKRIQAEEELLASRRHIQALSHRIDQAQEEERRRISRELHDELGGTLTALRLEIGALENVENLPTLAKEKLEAVEGVLSITLSTVRRLASQLRPQILDDLGLSAALRALVKDAARRAEFEHECHVPQEIPGDKDLHLHLYRICQEALTNICRHSKAQRVSLGLTRPYRDRLELLIVDDGCGYSAKEASEKGSMGLLGMAERVALLKGRLDISSSPGRGCRMRVEIPLENDLP